MQPPTPRSVGIKCVRMCVSLSTLLLLILKLGPDWCQGSRIFVRLACHLLSGKSAIYSVQQADKHISDMLTCISRRVHGHLHKSKHKQKETRILKAYNASPPPPSKKTQEVSLQVQSFLSSAFLSLLCLSCLHPQEKCPRFSKRKCRSPPCRFTCK